MCIKVTEDETLRSKNRPRVDSARAGVGGALEAIAERSRAAAGAAAAILSAREGEAVVVSGALPDSAQGLACAIAGIALRGDASNACGVVLRKSWGAQVCPDVLALQRRFGLRDLSLLGRRDDSALPSTWVALVNLGHEGALHADCAQLRAIAESVHEACTLRAQVHEATLLTQRLEDVAHASGDWSWETDEHFRYTWVHGTVPCGSQAVFRPPTIGELIPSGLVVNWLGEPEPPLRDLHAVLRQGEAIVRMVTREYAYGSSRYVSRSAVPLLHADGSLRGFRGSARDVTQSIEAKAQVWQRSEVLCVAKEQAEASSQAKSMLVSKVGHELRTPLNAIVGLAQLIQTGGALGEAATLERWVAQIAKTGWHMVDVLDMLMELGRAGAVGVSITNKSVDLVEVVREATHILEREAQARSITIAFDGPAPVVTAVDRRAICQVVVNLLSNAIKYNREGGWVRLSVTQGEQARIEIQDTGPGLTEAQVARMYQPFERLGAEASNVAGHGLGLLICKELVASMHGKLQVHSRVGHGTTFTVLLPLSGACEGTTKGDLIPEIVAQGIRSPE
ncbi:MAG: HAMP domain-containing histidine kinase [Rhizobacter sp.]|nr:HAMP domain-containing histidine kinase [Rhizobacter sp.]